jgi:hypothetical protein
MLFRDRFLLHFIWGYDTIFSRKQLNGEVKEILQLIVFHGQEKHLVNILVQLQNVISLILQNLSNHQQLLLLMLQ